MIEVVAICLIYMLFLLFATTVLTAIAGMLLWMFIMLFKMETNLNKEEY